MEDELKIWEDRERRKHRRPQPAVLTDQDDYVSLITSDIESLREQLDEPGIDLLKRWDHLNLNMPAGYLGVWGTPYSSEDRFAAALRMQQQLNAQHMLMLDSFDFAMRPRRRRIWWKPWTWFWPKARAKS